MISRLIKIGIFVVIGLLGYNYFFGDVAEKAQSREIVGKATDLGKDAWNLLNAEKEKMDEGKYDGAFDKLKGLYGELREAASRLDNNVLEDIERMDEFREELSRKYDRATSENDKKAIADELDNLTKKTEELMKKLEKGS